MGLLGLGLTWDVDESTCETMSTGADDCQVGLQAALLRDLYRGGFIDGPALGSLDETFSVKMVQIGSKNDHVMSFRMRGETSFGKLMRAWCSHHGVPLEKLCFSMYEDGCFDRGLKPKDYPWGDSVTPIKFDEWDDLDGDSDSSDEENPWKEIFEDEVKNRSKTTPALGSLDPGPKEAPDVAVDTSSKQCLGCTLCTRNPIVGSCDLCHHRCCRGCLEETTRQCWVCLGYSSPQEREEKGPGAGRHYLMPLKGNWEDIWPTLKSYPNPTPLPSMKLEDPETYPFQSRFYELGELGESNVYPERCCLCDDMLDWYVPWGVCGACTCRFWKALLGRFSEAALIIMEFLQPVPAYSCPECEGGWPGWYCFYCGCGTPGPFEPVFPIERSSKGAL